MTVSRVPTEASQHFTGHYVVMELDHDTALLAVHGGFSYSERNLDDALADAHAAAEEAAKAGRKATYTVVTLADGMGGSTTYNR